MAIVTCPYAFDMNASPSIPAGASANVTAMNSNLIEVWLGPYSISLWGNYNYNAAGQLVGGTLTSYTVGQQIGTGWAPIIGVEGLSIDVISLLNNPATFTDAAIFAGNDIFYGSWDGNDVLNGYNGNDRMAGSGGNDTLNGGAGNDILNGGAGNDILNGGAGVDRIVGGGGNDIYFVDNARDVVVETSAARTEIDRIISSVNYSLKANFENLTLNGTAAINGTGNALNNGITGNSANNVLNGWAGNDVLNGGAGNDVLSGGTGNDVLSGGAGADRMAGGIGNDTYYIDSIGDVVAEAAASGTDRVISSISYTLKANVENLTLSGAAALNGTGNGLNNIIIGNNAGNILTGGLGMDTLTGGLGADTFDFNAIAESVAGAGCDTITDFLCGTDKIDLSTIDAILGGGTADDAFTFIDTAAFSAAGQVRFENGILYANVDANLAADFQINLTGVATFAATDALL